MSLETPYLLCGEPKLGLKYRVLETEADDHPAPPFVSNLHILAKANTCTSVRQWQHDAAALLVGRSCWRRREERLARQCLITPSCLEVRFADFGTGSSH